MYVGLCLRLLGYRGSVLEVEAQVLGFRVKFKAQGLGYRGSVFEVDTTTAVKVVRNAKMSKSRFSYPYSCSYPVHLYVFNSEIRKLSGKPNFFGLFEKFLLLTPSIIHSDLWLVKSGGSQQP